MAAATGNCKPQLQTAAAGTRWMGLHRNESVIQPQLRPGLLGRSVPLVPTRLYVDTEVAGVLPQAG